MKVFKFGGASVRDSSGVKNVAIILQKYALEKVLVVISAPWEKPPTLWKRS